MRRLLSLVCLLMCVLGRALASTPGLVGSSVCGDCHAAQFSAWSASHHRHAMAEAGPDTVRGDFNDARFSYAGIETRFQKQANAFNVRTDGPDGASTPYPIRYTFGYEPLQQYLIPFAQGRYQALSIAWDTRAREQGGQRWFHLYPDQNITHSDPLYWTGPYHTWNSRCAECHSTGVEKGFDATSRSWNTRFAEISVGCEACHGAGGEHVRRAKAGERGGLSVDPGRAGIWRFGEGAPIAARTGASALQQQLSVCGSCHSRRRIVGEIGSGKPYLDAHVPNLLDRTLYFDDGQIRDEVFEYGSFLQSRMAARGVTCSDCHDAHSGALKAPGNAVCHQCHQPARYDSSAHHHHRPGGAGTACADCHMPARLYMVIDARRDHSLRIPDPWLSAEIGSPNACTACHAGKDNAWAVAALESWGVKRVADRSHALLARSRHVAQDGQLAARRLAADAAAPPMLRATALSELRVTAESDLDLLAHALRDGDGLVRLGAARSFAGVPSEYRQAMLWPLLKDPLRAVRMEAVRLLAALPAAQLSAAQRAEREVAIKEYFAAQDVANDLAGAPLDRAALYISLGRPEAAEQAYREALSLEPNLVPAWINLADLYRATGREDASGEALRKALVIAPEVAATHHALGLHLVRLKRMDEALRELWQAQQLEPDNTRYAYVLAVALDSSGQHEEAVAIAEAAWRRAPADPDIRQLLVALQRSGGPPR